MQLKKPVLLEGSPGVGKTSLVLALGKFSGHSVVRINLSEQGLNAILDHRAEVFIPELGHTFKCPSSFRFFACQNPTNQGRKTEKKRRKKKKKTRNHKKKGKKKKKKTKKVQTEKEKRNKKKNLYKPKEEEAAILAKDLQAIGCR